MNATTKIIGRIAFAVAAVALLVGISGGLAKAQPVDIDSGPMTVARALCVGSGGDWELTNGIFRCYYGDHYTGHGWACDMTVSPPVCWSFFTVPTGGVKVDLGAAQIGNLQVASSTGDSSGLPVNVASVQAQIAAAQVAATPTPARVKVATASKANAAIISAP
jgi:hypothetical protein